jgi:hypothetical protein
MRNMTQSVPKQAVLPALGDGGGGARNSVHSSSGTVSSPSSVLKPRGSPDKFMSTRRVSFQMPDDSSQEQVEFTLYR